MIGRRGSASGALGVRIAVLMTSYNRRECTLRSLEAIEQQWGRPEIDVVLVDAGSADGTPDEVRLRFPRVRVVNGTSDMYWNKGMRAAFQYALQRGYDFYLWLNDDTYLDADAVHRLVRTWREVSREGRRPVIVVGSTRNPHRGEEITYGGLRRHSAVRPTHFVYVAPRNKPQRIHTMNGNCVLVAAPVVARIGLLDPEFTHGLGDYDYGLRARRAGCDVWLAPGTLGVCARGAEPWHVLGGPGRAGRFFQDPKGLPLREWYVFVRRWGGCFWPIFLMAPYIREVAKGMGALLRRKVSFRRRPN